LHAPYANIRTLGFFLPRLRVGGYAVIEDIHESALPLWRAVGKSLSMAFVSALVEMRSAYCFVARRIN